MERDLSELCQRCLPLRCLLKAYGEQVTNRVDLEIPLLSWATQVNDHFFVGKL